MLDQAHEVVFPPEDNCTIWRYMDFTKFLSLIENRKLVIARADQFDDPYEGALSKEAIRLLREMESKTKRPPGQSAYPDRLISISGSLRESMFISCWCASEHESAALWKLYLQSAEGIAIRSDFNALVDVLTLTPLTARISRVKYVDYDRVAIPAGNLLFPFVHKRISFAHENELRALIWGMEHGNSELIDEDAKIISIDIDPERLIKAVHVSPIAPHWFGKLVEQILKRYGLKVPLIRSTLYERPSY